MGAGKSILFRRKLDSTEIVQGISMIMRRIAMRLAGQDWLAVTIEFALIVAGVFVGIQVANWNDSRKDRELEATYLARIAQDIRSDVSEMDEIIRVSAVRLALFNVVLPKASGHALPDGFDSARGRIGIESVPAYADGGQNSPGFALFILTSLEGSRSAYNTMISAGGLTHISNARMLQQVEEYYAAVDRERHFEVALEQNRDKFVDAERKAGISPVNPMSVDEISAAFAASSELLATAQNYWLYTNRHLRLMRALQAQAHGLADALSQASSAKTGSTPRAN